MKYNLDDDTSSSEDMIRVNKIKRQLQEKMKERNKKKSQRIDRDSSPEMIKRISSGVNKYTMP